MLPTETVALRSLLGSCLRPTASSASSSSFLSAGHLGTPLSNAIPHQRQQLLLQPQNQQRRWEVTTARTKRARNIPPHFSFSPPPEPESDIIVFNPPSAAASVYHTPFKFLPSSDPRRIAGLAAFVSQDADSNAAAIDAEVDPSLLPDVRLDRSSWASRGEPKYNVSFEQAMEMKRLRAEDPRIWTVHKLAAKFDCSPRFVVQCAPLPRDYRQQQDEALEKSKRTWGEKKTRAREDKAKRREMLLSNRL